MKEYKVDSIGTGNAPMNISNTISDITISKNTTLSPRSFAYNAHISSVTIENDVKVIGKMAFYKCVSLKEVILAADITEIGDMAFSGCESLLSVKIPLSVTFIGKDAFSSCGENFELVVVPESKAHQYAIDNSIRVSFYNQPTFSVNYYDTDRNLLGTESVLYGERCKQAEYFGKYISNFKSWDKDTNYVTEDLVLMPIVNENTKVCISFLSEDLTIATQIIERGDVIDYDAAEQMLEDQNRKQFIKETNSYKKIYDFAGWDTKVETAQNDLIVSAVYDVTEIVKHEISFVCLGQQIYTQYVLHGGDIDYDTANEMLDQLGMRSIKSTTEIHDFVKWDQSVRTATDSMTITGIYHSYYAENEQIGEYAYASFLKDTLYIYGTGITYDYSDKTPHFFIHKDKIQDIYIEGEVECSDSFVGILLGCCDISHIHGNVVGKIGETITYRTIDNMLKVTGTGYLPSSAFDSLETIKQNIEIVEIDYDESDENGFGYGVFNGMNNLKTLTIPFVGESRENNIMKTGGKTSCIGYFFEESDTPQEGFVEQNYIVDGDIVYSKIPETLEEINITNPKFIPFGAFQNIKNLKRLTIGDSCERIYGKILKGCNKIEELTVPFIGKNYCYSDFDSTYDMSLGYWFDYERIEAKYDAATDDWLNTREDMFNPPTGIRSTRNFEAKWDEEVDYGEVTRHKTLYGYKACQYTTPNSLKKVTITSDSIIPTGAFAYETNIEEVSAVNSKEISWFAFYGATKLKKLDMPSLEHIRAFGLCKTHSLETVPQEQLKTIGAYSMAFSGIKEFCFNKECVIETTAVIGNPGLTIEGGFIFYGSQIEHLSLSKKSLTSMNKYSLAMASKKHPLISDSYYWSKSVVEDESDEHKGQCLLTDFDYDDEVTPADIINACRGMKKPSGPSYTTRYTSNVPDAYEWLFQYSGSNETLDCITRKAFGAQSYYYVMNHFPDFAVFIDIRETNVEIPSEIKYIGNFIYASNLEQNSVTITIGENVLYIGTLAYSNALSQYNFIGKSEDNESNEKFWTELNVPLSSMKDKIFIDGTNFLHIPQVCYWCIKASKNAIKSLSDEEQATIKDALRQYMGGDMKINNGVLEFCIHDDTETPIVVPNNVTEIAQGAFDISSAKSIELHNGIRTLNSIPYDLESLDIPQSVTTMNFKDAAFVTVNINELTIPSSVTSLSGQICRTGIVNLNILASIENLSDSPIQFGYAGTSHIFKMPSTLKYLTCTADKYLGWSGSGWCAEGSTAVNTFIADDNQNIAIQISPDSVDGNYRDKFIRSTSDKSSTAQIIMPKQITYDVRSIATYAMMRVQFNNLYFSEQLEGIGGLAFWKSKLNGALKFIKSDGSIGENRLVLIGYDLCQSISSSTVKFADFNGEHVKIIDSLVCDHFSTQDTELSIHELTSTLGGCHAADTAGTASSYGSYGGIPEWLMYTQSSGYGSHMWYNFGKPTTYTKIFVDDRNQDYKTVCNNQVLLTRDGRRLLTIAKGSQFENGIFEIPEGVERMDELALGVKNRSFQSFNTIVLPDSFIVTECVPLVNMNVWGNTLTAGVYFDSYIVRYDVHSTNVNYESIDGVLYSRNRLDMWALPVSKYGDCFEIKEGTQNIKHGAIPCYSALDTTIKATLTLSRNFHFSEIKIPASVSNIDDTTTYYRDLETYLRFAPDVKDAWTPLYILNKLAMNAAAYPDQFTFTFDTRNRWYKQVSATATNANKVSVTYKKLVKRTAASEIAAFNFNFLNDGITYYAADEKRNGFARAFLMALRFLYIVDIDNITALSKWQALCEEFLNVLCPSGYNINKGGAPSLSDTDLHKEFVKNKNNVQGLKTAIDKFSSTNTNPIIIKIVDNGDNGPNFHYFLATKATLNSSNCYEITAFGGIDFNPDINGTTHVTNTNIDFDRPFKIYWGANVATNIRKVYAHLKNDGLADDTFSDIEYDISSPYGDISGLDCAIGDIMWCDMNTLMRHRFDDNIDLLSKMWETLEN